MFALISMHFFHPPYDLLKFPVVVFYSFQKFFEIGLWVFVIHVRRLEGHGHAQNTLLRRIMILKSLAEIVSRMWTTLCGVCFCSVMDIY